MKKRFTILAAAFALLAFLAIPMGMWGQTRTEVVAYTLDGTQTGGSNGYATESEITQDGITWMVTANTDINPWRFGGKSLDGIDRPMYSTNQIVDNVTKVVITNGTTNLTVNSMTLIVSANADFSNPTSTITGEWAASATTTFERPADADWTNKYYKLVYNLTNTSTSNKYAQFVGADFYKEMDASTPSINAEDVEIAYDATSGAIAYTIENPVSGGVLTAATESEWLTLGTVGATIPFTCVANTTTSPRTATVTLTYTYNTDQTVAKNIMVTQSANPNVVDLISDITATGTYTVQGTIVAKSQRGFIVGDGTGYVYYYNQNYTQADYNIGDMVKLAGPVVVYGKVYEFNNNATITTAETSNYVAENPTVLTGEELDAWVNSNDNHLSDYIQYQGTLSVNGTHYNITDIAGATIAQGSISYPISTDFTSLDGSQVIVTGYYVGYSTSSTTTTRYYNTMLGSIEEIPSSDPSITAEDVNIEYNATTGAIAYTINNPVSGGELTAATESGWLTLGTVGATVPFTCTANTAAASRTATVTLTYTYNRTTVTKDVTVTQAGNSNIVNSISDITAEGEYTVQGTIVAINNRGFVLGDGTGYVYYYYGDNFEYDNYDIGDMVRLSGSVVVYGKVYEFNNSTTISYVTESNYVAEAPTELSGADMDAQVASSSTAQLSSYVQYVGTLSISGSGNNIHYNITNIAGAETAKGSISYPLNVDEITALDGKQVIVTGYYVGVSSNQYYNTMIGSIEENTDPAILLDTYEIEVAAEGGEGNINATYLNFGNYSFEPYINFYAEDGTTYATYDWITAEIDATHNVHYVVAANQGEARTAYFRVEYSNYEGPDGKRNDPLLAIDASSDLVTITQAAYVAPTYAELPFEFNEGRAAIEETDGLYQEGLGTDYSATYAPNTKLKFDGTGDWLLLQFNERPGTLTFNIRNNSFSGGTFKVQTSEDGVTYTDLFTYTEITETQDEEFSDLGENVRYIKWIYTEKVSGNVGLGNIVLDEYTEPVPTITLDTYSVNVPAEGNEGTINVTYQNFDVYAEDLFVGFCDENDSEASYDWITVEFDANNNVHYIVEANQGEARTAYFRVCHFPNDYGEPDLKSLRNPWAFTAYTSDMVTVTQAAYVAPFQPATYTLATTIESGKTYIIVGQGDGNYYAMGQQNNNNRAAVGITVEGTTATVSSEEVYEFTISSLAVDGFYSIYDARTPGYLYAAASGSNHLKTESELDSDHNGEWEITFDADNNVSIVASQSSNRNVMQYNRSATLFSCYGSASQHPVYLYVKEEATTATQTTNLVAGWNWFSTYVEVEDPVAMLQAVEASLGENGVMIKSSDVYTENDADWGWFGDLDEVGIVNEQMYKILVSSPCTVTVEGTPANPENHPITINQGWNWIGFPCSEAMSLDDAFAGFAQDGDIIRNSDGETPYDADWEMWFGDLETLQPGQGFMYYSASSTPRTLVFNTGAKAN